MAVPTTYTDAYGAVVDTGRNSQMTVNLVWLEQHTAAAVGTDTGTKGLTVVTTSSVAQGNSNIPHFDNWQSYQSPR